MNDVFAEAAKLALGISAFVLVTWLGLRDKRIGGVLLTFPLLNGIAMLTGVDPIGIAGTIYLVATWNSWLFLFSIHRNAWLPPLPAGLDQDVTIYLRVAVWMALWAIGATAVAWSRDALSYAGWLWIIQLVLAAVYVRSSWRPRQPAPAPAFRKMWINKRGAGRIISFAVTFFFLAAVAFFNPDSRWVGWASALPLPGIFALATLSATQGKDDLLPLGDTVLLGPLLVIPFNWLLARAIVHLRLEQAGALAEIATVIVFWLAAAGIIAVLVPPFARWRDARRAAPPTHSG